MHTSEHAHTQMHTRRCTHSSLQTWKGPLDWQEGQEPSLISLSPVWK